MRTDSVHQHKLTTGSCGHQEVLEASWDGQSVQRGGPGSLKGPLAQTIHMCPLSRVDRSGAVESRAVVGTVSPRLAQKPHCDEKLQVMPGSQKYLFGSRISHQARQLAVLKKACCPALPSQVPEIGAHGPAAPAQEHSGQPQACRGSPTGPLNVCIPRKHQSGGGLALQRPSAVSSDATGTLQF